MTGEILSLKGIYPPIPTPFTAAGDVHHTALSDNLAHWNQYDLAGYVVLGSNGEAPYLGWKEKLKTLETARRGIPNDKQLIAGTGLESTAETIALTQDAARIGADAALVLTPHYFGGKMTSDSLTHHYWAVADAATIPIILYSVPKFTHVDIDAATAARLSQHPNIIGIKDSGGNIAKIAATVHQTPPAFQVLAGSASFLFAALTLGAVGGVLALANVAPQACLSIFQHTQSGTWNTAAELQRQVIAVNAAITAQYGIAGLKCAMDFLGYYGGPVRPPLLPLTEPERQALETLLVQSNLI